MLGNISLGYLVIPALIALVYFFRRRDLDHIPTVGYSDPFLSWISALQYFSDTRAMLTEGYKLYPDGAFKIATIDGWYIVLNGNHYINDLTRADPNTLSGLKALDDIFQLGTTLGETMISVPYHTPVIRTSVTRNMDLCFHNIHEQLLKSLGERLPGVTEGWAPIPAHALAVDVICRVNARYFFGQPLCDDPGLLAVCEQTTRELFKGRLARYFPDSLKPSISKVFTRAHNLRSQMEQFIRPLVEERFRLETPRGFDTGGKPNDLISWLMDGASAAKEPVTVADISSRVLLVNFTSTHTTSAVFTATLFQLCLNSEDVAELRVEIQDIVKEEGWTRSAVSKMHKLDSYIRETQRVHCIANLIGVRTVLNKYTFSDGLSVPKGAFLCVNAFSRHRATEFYSNAHIFDGFRYAREGGQNQLLATSPTMDYHAFGHGRSACPGRFFAITEIKLILAHVVIHYDVKLENDTYPAKILFEGNALPNHEARVSFRRRGDY